MAQVDFGLMGLVFDPETDCQRVLHALVVTLVLSRHQCVYLTHRRDLDALIAGIEGAWEAFGGVTRRLILDNMKAAVVKSDRYEPVFNRTFQEYSQHRGFIIDPAPVRHPEAKGCVENQVKYVRDNFFAGEQFTTWTMPNGRPASGVAPRWGCASTAPPASGPWWCSSRRNSGPGRKSTSMECFTWVNTILGNPKTAISGTYHAFDFKKYADRYLAEYQYRFNHRFDLIGMLTRLIKSAARTGKRTEAWLQLAEDPR